MYDFVNNNEDDEFYKNEDSKGVEDEDFNESRSSHTIPTARSTSNFRDFNNTNLHSWDQKSSKSEEITIQLMIYIQGSSKKNSPLEVLPNGYTRKDFHDAGYSDNVIEF